MSVGFLAVALFWEAFAQNELPAISFRVLIFNRIITKYKKKILKICERETAQNLRQVIKSRLVGWIAMSVAGAGAGAGC